MRQAIGTPGFWFVGRVFGRPTAPRRRILTRKRYLSGACMLLPCWLHLMGHGARASDCSDGQKRSTWFLAADASAGEADCLLQVAGAQDPQLLVADVIGVSGQSIPVTISLAVDDDLADRGKTFLMFRGLPETVQLSVGFKMRSAWAVSWRDIKDVALVAKPGYEGTFQLEVLFHRGPDLPPLQRTVSVTIRPPDRREARAGAVPPAALPVPDRQIAPTAAIAQEPPRVPPATNLTPFEESAMLANGRNFVSSGNLATARFVFEDLAAKGSGPGAFALAQTFDPRFLKTIVVVGPQQANLEQARKWYRTAAERGHREAQERLRALERGQR